MAITKEQVKRGTKVQIPTKKTEGQSLDRSVEVRDSLAQGFMFITGWDETRVTCASEIADFGTGDWFALDDLDLYEEPMDLADMNEMDAKHPGWDEPQQAAGITKPSHYNSTSITAIQVIQDWGTTFCVGNAIKYLARYKQKGTPIEDLQKAMTYIKYEIDALKLQGN